MLDKVYYSRGIIQGWSLHRGAFAVEMLGPLEVEPTTGVSTSLPLSERRRDPG
jgi:hypothetical protein